MQRNGNRIALLVMVPVLLVHAPPADASGEESLPVLTVDEALQVALANHPAPVAAEAQLDAAQTKAVQVSAWHDPTVSLMTGIPFASPTDPPLLEVKVAQSFPLSPILSYKQEEQEAKASAQASQVPTSQLDVQLAVATVYYRLVSLQEIRDVALEQRDLAEGIVEAATLRYSSLAGNQADVLRAKISQDEAETAIDVLDLEIESAREVLVLLMGDGRDPSGFTVQDPAGPLVKLGQEALVALAFSTRPELGYFDAQAVALDAQKKVAKSENVPWLTVTAGYQYKSDTLVGLMGQDAFALGFALNIPVAQIKKNKAAVDEVDALLVANDAQKDQLALDIAQQVVVQVKKLDGLQKKLDLQEDKVIPEATSALELTLSAYTAQKASITDVLSAFDKLLDAKYQRAILKGRYFEEFAKLERAVGTFEVPLQ